MKNPMIIQRDSESTAKVENFKFHALEPVIVIFLVASFTIVALRFYTRQKYAKLWWDDWLMGLALLFFSVYCSTTLGMFVLSGGAAGIEMIPYHNMEVAVKLLIVSECFYILTMIVLKLSLSMFFLRILAAQCQRWLIIAVVSLSTAFGAAYFFFAIFQCGWVDNIDIFITRMILGQCASKPVGMAMNYTYSLLGTISDWTCGLVPIFLLKDSNMPRKAKTVVCCLLAFASMGSIASIVRMVYLDAITVPTGSFFKNIAKLAIWSTIEPGIGIIAASAATLRHLFQRVFKRSRLFTTLPASTRPTAANTIACTTTITQELSRMQSDKSRQESDVTTLQGSTTWIGRSSVEKSMAVEMRAYGMHDFDECANLTEQDLEGCDTECRTRSSGSMICREQRANARYERSTIQAGSCAARPQTARTFNLGDGGLQK